MISDTNSKWILNIATMKRRRQQQSDDNTVKIKTIKNQKIIKNKIILPQHVCECVFVSKLMRANNW